MIDLRKRYPDVRDLLLRVRLFQLHRSMKFYDLPERYSILITYDDVADPADEADSLLAAMKLLMKDTDAHVVDNYLRPDLPAHPRFINLIWDGVATDEVYAAYDAIYHLIAPDYRDVQAAVQEWENRVITDDEAKKLANSLFK